MHSLIIPPFPLTNIVDDVGEVFLFSRGLADVFHPQRPSAHLIFG